MKKGVLVRTISMALCALGLSSCLVPGIHNTVDHIGVQSVYSKDTVTRPHDLVVYSLDGSYYMEMQLRFVQCDLEIFRFEGLSGSTGGWRLYHTDSKELERIPTEKYLVRLSKDDVFDILQHKVESLPENAPKYIAAAKFDYTRAKRCDVKPIQFTNTNNPRLREYGPPSCYTPRLSTATTTLHTCMRPLAWASWLIEVPVAVVSNTVFYTVGLIVVAPYRAIEKAFSDEQKVTPPDAPQETSRQ
ncbi:MAG: hypothetical protein IJ943_01225 [Akkermansia sp.]|nr:hypothetical protein [Akkermansia sp.]